jgi:hypothetical protein
MKIRAFWDVAMLALMMEAVRTSAMLVYYKTTRHNIPEGSNRHTHCHENLKSHKGIHLLQTNLVNFFVCGNLG